MLVTDAWEPQVNGVVRTLRQHHDTNCKRWAARSRSSRRRDYPNSIPLITYSEIRLALGARDDVEERFLAFAPDAVHIATEGTLGWDARAICLKHKFPFTTRYHTQFPEYVTARFSWIPLWAGYRFMHAFHDKSGRVMVATPTMMEVLRMHGFRNITRSGARGVDIETIPPRASAASTAACYKDLPKPDLRVCRAASRLKRISRRFLKTDLPGTKVVVGDGPALEDCRRNIPTPFHRPKFGEELARHYADADVFVFPSFTDTFGLVILEAMACGTPVAGFVAPGPQDIIPGTGAGAMNNDLQNRLPRGA